MNQPVVQMQPSKPSLDHENKTASTQQHEADDTDQESVWRKNLDHEFGIDGLSDVCADWLPRASNGHAFCAVSTAVGNT